MHKDYPLTKQQLGLWIEQKLHPSNTSYNTCVKVKLTGKLDTNRFREASRDVIHFFDTLKVYFVEKNGVPYQRIDEDVNYLPEFLDISEDHTSETKEKAAQAKRILSDKLNTSIDLNQFPIMRASLIKTAEEVYYFIGMVPHIVSDGRAAILYLESLSVAYNQGKSGLVETYGVTKKNWQNFFDDQLDQIDSEAYILNKRHWLDRLKNANHYFDYSYGKQLIDPDDKRGERVYFDLSEETALRLKAHSKSQRTTLFNVFVCAFSIFIHKYYRLDDLLIGYPVNIRPPGYKHFFGFFVNILPIRVDMKGDPSYIELLKNIHKIRKEDKKHQKYPALDIVSDIRDNLPDFDGRVFNLSMAQTVSRLFNLELDGIVSQPLDSEYYDVNDDFSLSYELIEKRIGLWFEYRKSLFDREFINQAMQHIESILQQMLDFPDRKISEFELLNAEQQKLAYQSNSSHGDLAYDLIERKNIVSLFEEQVSITPEMLAIIDGNYNYSYQQINRKSNQLARKILGLTGGRSQPIAISLERSCELIVSLLAVLKAGCFYIPIPPNYPHNRITHILNEAQVAVLIINTQNEARTDIVDVQSKRVILNLNVAKNSIKLLSDDNLDLSIEKNNRAYIIYTSGSTGKPKGVVLNHANVVPRLMWLRDYFKLSNKDRVLQNTDFSFDVSVAEIFWPLISGATLVISDQTKSRDPKYLLSLIEENEVTCSCMVPSLLRALINVDSKLQLSTISHLLSAGEALPDQLRKDFYDNPSTSRASLYNFYGPTEAAIYASFEKTSLETEGVVTIGRPLGNTRLLVLDEQQKIVPSGVVGELYIGGLGVAKEYHANDELTKKAFVMNGFSENSEERLYRTGDLVRFNFEGNLEYIGRIDKQVKVRGFRVELGEIESVIADSLEIFDLAVVDFPITKSQTQLVAYLVINEQGKDESHIIASVKKAIQLNLPSYMMPSIFSIINEIPRLPSGKVDKVALPNPQSLVTINVGFQSPSSDNEIYITEIWSTILSIDFSKISIHASFFDMGGDSLMAIQFVSLAEQKGLFFDIGDLFELRNIKELALVAKSTPPQAFNNEKIVGSYPLLPRQAKFFEDGFVNQNHWNRTFSFSVNHRLDKMAFKTAIKAVLEHHDNLRVKFIQSPESGWQQYCESAECLTSEVEDIVKFYDVSELPENDLNQLMKNKINQRHKQIDVSNAPLIRIIHFSTSNDRGKLAIIFHHLLLDMVSSRLIFEDLMMAYQSARNNLPLSLPSKSTSVRDWTLHLSEIKEKKDFSASLSYWANMPETPTPDLPLDYIGEPLELNNDNNEGSAQLKAFFLDSEHTQQLLVDVPKQIGMPIQDFLLASLFEVMSDWSTSEENSNSMMVSTCGHGRQVDSKAYNLSRTVGWLNTVFPVHLQFPQSANIAKLDSLEFLNRVQEQLANIPSENIDYNLLRYAIKHPEILKHSTPNLFFNYVGQIDSFIPAGAPFLPTLDLPGLASIAAENHLCYQLYFEAGVIGGQLTFRLTYSQNLLSKVKIDALASALLSCIERRLGDICG